MSTRIHAIQEYDEVRTSLVRELIGRVMTISGDVDAFTEPTFEGFLREAAERHEVTTLDLSGIDFFGSAGVEPLRDFAQSYGGEILTSAAIDRILAILGVELT